MTNIKNKLTGLCGNSLLQNEIPNAKAGVRVVKLMDKEFRGELVLKAHRLVYHSTPGSRVIKKKKDPNPQMRIQACEW